MNRLPFGFLVAIEGLDGAGKTTLAHALAKRLEEEGYSVVLTRQPGGTPFGEKIRRLLHDAEKRPVPLAEYLLFAADRAEHMETTVLPALREGKIVISDRMGDSSLAYQGYGSGVDKDFIRLVNAKALQEKTADLTIYLRLAPEAVQSRIGVRGKEKTSFEREHSLFFTRVAEGFDALYQEPRANLCVFDALLAPSVLAEKAYADMRVLLHESRGR